jgi:hypothetical protein
MNPFAYVPLALYVVGAVISFRAASRRSLRWPALIVVGLAISSTFGGLLFRYWRLIWSPDQVPIDHRASLLAAGIAEMINCITFTAVACLILTLAFGVGSLRNRR